MAIQVTKKVNMNENLLTLLRILRFNRVQRPVVDDEDWRVKKFDAAEEDEPSRLRSENESELVSLVGVGL